MTLMLIWEKSLSSDRDDESDPTFSLLQPHLVVLTNLDKEHLENYNNNYTNLERSVLKHINSIPFYGKVF